MKINWKWIAFWSILFYLIYTWPFHFLAKEKDRNDPVRLWVYPEANFCLWDPCYIHAMVFARPNKDNRWVSLVWASEEWESGSTFRELEGEKAPLVPIDQLVRVGQGSYIFEACIYRFKNGKSKRLCDRRLVNGAESY